MNALEILFFRFPLTLRKQVVALWNYYKRLLHCLTLSVSVIHKKWLFRITHRIWNWQARHQQNYMSSPLLLLNFLSWFSYIFVMLLILLDVWISIVYVRILLTHFTDQHTNALDRAARGRARCSSFCVERSDRSKGPVRPVAGVKSAMADER